MGKLRSNIQEPVGQILDNNRFAPRATFIYPNESIMKQKKPFRLDDSPNGTTVPIKLDGHFLFGIPLTDNRYFKHDSKHLYKVLGLCLNDISSQTSNNIDTKQFQDHALLDCIHQDETILIVERFVKPRNIAMNDKKYKFSDKEREFFEKAFEDKNIDFKSGPKISVKADTVTTIKKTIYSTTRSYESKN